MLPNVKFHQNVLPQNPQAAQKNGSSAQSQSRHFKSSSHPARFTTARQMPYSYFSAATSSW
jgi:hypothetical protein